MSDDVYCRNCGVRLYRLLGRWRHAKSLGPVPCRGAEPEPRPEPGPEPGAPPT